MDPYENLANAIVIRAAEDYRKVLRRWERYPDKKAYIKEKESLESFSALTGLELLLELTLNCLFASSGKSNRS